MRIPIEPTGQAWKAFDAWLGTQAGFEMMTQAAASSLMTPAKQAIVCWMGWLVSTVEGGQILHRLNGTQRQGVLDFGIAEGWVKDEVTNE
jgi:hypothetical protein